MSETNRVIAGQGDDAASIMTGNVVPAKIAEVKGNADVMKRTISAATPFVRYLYINTQRVTDLQVRQALNYAFDRDAYIKAVGGYDVAEPASTTLAPVVPGYKKFDEYPGANGGSNGDVEKAKSLLQGKTVPKLKFCFANTPVNQTVMAVIQGSLTKAGFTFSSSPIDPAAYYTTVGDKTTDCDIMAGGWAQDFPDGDSTLGVLFDGSKIVDKGNNNLGYLNDAAINAKLLELRGLADRSQAAAQYGDLDQQIMKAAPVIPLRYDRFFSIYGSKVGGTFASPLWAQFNITGIYVKS
ncbi:ABC transporter substrate-binding protein [Luedemannella flava]